MHSPVKLEFTAQGYLILSAAVAERYFPSGMLVLQLHGRELWLLPTRGAAAGGLLLKQRNAAGDRSVLIDPYLPEGTSYGTWPALWDEQRGALRAVLPDLAIASRDDERGVAAHAIVQQENGRWAVYLDIGLTSAAAAVRVERKRIADYPTEERARVAASWIERTADRPLPR